MTEEDTFNKLRKPSLGEMIDIYRASGYTSYGYKDELETGFFKSYGWDFTEFLTMWTALIVRNNVGG